jgi:hypothetical protein
VGSAHQVFWKMVGRAHPMKTSQTNIDLRAQQPTA